VEKSAHDAFGIEPETRKDACDPERMVHEGFARAAPDVLSARFHEIPGRTDPLPVFRGNMGKSC